MRAFIIRPFGTKEGIDFEAVERELINPALAHHNISGRTTMDIMRQGNIRIDMFQRLLTADIVITDISIHNANVFYELGVRHALRDKRTFLIRCTRADIPQADVPFDIKTDRYLSYPKDDPASCLPQLVEGLRQSLNTEAQDSPVFQLLPDLQAQERSRFLPVPLDFREEVGRAEEGEQPGDLGLLAEEAQGLEWESEGLRVVGRAQFRLGDFKGARATWEAVRRINPFDPEANLLLGTVYARLGRLTESTQALERTLSAKGIEKDKRAEAHALLARNAKTLLREEYEAAPPESRAEVALRSGHLEDSFENYEHAFEEDLNHFYSGLNALAMLTVRVELAAARPLVWAERFDTDEEAEKELAKLRGQAAKIAAAVELSLDVKMRKLESANEKDPWAEISVADLRCITSKRPQRVASAYRDALAGASDQAVESVRGQLAFYNDLGVLTPNVAEALKVTGLPEPEEDDAGDDRRVLIFTGHMVDAPGRERPRFPADKEGAARQKIKEAVEAEMKAGGGVSFGIAGGASGGDILFHEVCSELGVPTRLYLALQPGLYVRESVQKAGPEWVERFRRLHSRLTGEGAVRVLCEADDEGEHLPAWLQAKPAYNIWQRVNLWMLHNALAAGGDDCVTLIALWDREPTGDGLGGTSDLVEKVERRGAKAVVIDTKKEFGL
jgi:tetratricopeptide (TPR) repeat protein